MIEINFKLEQVMGDCTDISNFKFSFDGELCAYCEEPNIIIKNKRLFCKSCGKENYLAKGLKLSD